MNNKVILEDVRVVKVKVDECTYLIELLADGLLKITQLCEDDRRMSVVETRVNQVIIGRTK